MKRIFIIVSFLAVLTSVNVYFLNNIHSYYNGVIKEVEKRNNVYLNNIDSVQNPLYFFKNYLINDEYSNKRIDNVLTYSGNDSLGLFKLYDKLNNETLIYRFSGNYCDECNLFVIKKIKQHFTDFATSNRILFIGTDVNSRLKDGFYEKNILSIKKGNLGLPLEDKNVPFLFVTNNKGVIKLIFIPEKSMPRYTDLYLENFKSRFSYATE